VRGNRGIGDDDPPVARQELIQQRWNLGDPTRAEVEEIVAGGMTDPQLGYQVTSPTPAR
jgi:hypothetical protein